MIHRQCNCNIPGGGRIVGESVRREGWYFADGVGSLWGGPIDGNVAHKVVWW